MYGSQGPVVSLASLPGGRLLHLRSLWLLLYPWDNLKVDDAAPWLKIDSPCRHRYVQIVLSWLSDVVVAVSLSCLVDLGWICRR